ncbi:replication-relaxation family protein [Actinacidiphila epipremni]|uniref:DUF1682 domain-containing protein n=1 Tax=Actinacidiphila epipremni TaxID=2053013 RepID=A0ABX0ZYG7_9ACTN|nr:replication-relaxation family protein [Actinacidiphila epipremni]NJP47797.1 hypothetical protein [Actinacidiphila epipremni]
MAPTAFIRGGRLPGSPAGMGVLESWRTEVPHALTSSGRRNVRADAVFQDKTAGVPLLMVEVDRATESAHVLADKVGASADFYARRVRPPGQPSTGRSTIGDLNTVPFWETLYPRTGLPGWPPLAIVLTGAGPTALDNRMRSVGQLSREFWAGTEHADYSYGATDADDGDFYLDFTAKVPLVMTTLDRLQQHGPMGPVWFRVAQHRGGEPEPLLQALTDTHTAAEYRQRRKQRQRAAEAAEAERQRRKAAEQQQLDEERKRAEWFRSRKRKVKKLARQWDEPKTADER